MRRDIIYLWDDQINDSMSLNMGDQEYNSGKKYKQKGTLCGPNNHQHIRSNKQVL